MPHDVVVDVVVPDVVPVVDVAAVGVQGPPGEPGEPGPAGPPGPQGESGDAAGPHAVTHQSGGVDPITALDAGVLTGTVTTNVLAPIVTATSNVSVGATPAQSGAIRLQNNAALMARNAANSGDVEVIKVDATNQILIGGVAPGGGALPTAPVGQVLVSQGAGVPPVFTDAARIATSFVVGAASWAGTYIDSYRIVFSDTQFVQRNPGTGNYDIGLPSHTVILQSLIPIQIAERTLAATPASPVGTLQNISDSTVNTPGATIAGGGTFHVLGRFNGTVWKVVAGG